MMPTHSPTVHEGLRFIAMALAVTVALILIGWIPTTRLAGLGARPAMVAGCAISLLGSAVGVVPIVLALRGPVRSVPQAILLSTLLRFLVVLVLALSAALSGWFDRVPLLIWVAISYLFLLMTDTIFAVRVGGAAQTSEK